jgi:hypothetical protein
MPGEKDTLLIADLYGRIEERCEPGPTVHGEVWLTRHEGTLFIYWEAWEVPFEENGTPRWSPGYADGRGTVTRTHGVTRWQAVAVIAGERLPDSIRDLAFAFGDRTKRDLLLRTALAAIGEEIRVPLQRGRFLLDTHQWRERDGIQGG